jgi:hypothetical protein
MVGLIRNPAVANQAQQEGETGIVNGANVVNGASVVNGKGDVNGGSDEDSTDDDFEIIVPVPSLFVTSKT